jgi:2-(1,2-epoxy-1,2-dihydrophenyl)acetyl-CoA isomerase
MRFACDAAVFNVAFLDRGVAGDMGLAWSLLRLVGPERAWYLTTVAEKFDAAEALRVGLVSQVFPAATFREDMARIVDRLAGLAPLALRTLKENYRAATRIPDLDDYIEYETPRHHDLIRTADSREAFRAFLEKRRPEFVGR